MSQHRGRFLALVALTWLLGGPLLARTEPPPRPSQVPLEVPVDDLGQNEQLPLKLRTHYHPATRAGNPVTSSAPIGYPLAELARKVNPFGWRLSGRSTWRVHTGVDLVAPEGTAVLAVLPGNVRLVDQIRGYGLTVVIDHGLGWQSVYGHLLDLAVRPGESIAAGQPIGRVGRSGDASTAQLHFEWRQRYQGRMVAVDPTPLLQVRAGGASLAERPKPKR